MSNIDELHLNSPREFLDALRPSNSRWLRDENWMIPWVFRGQEDANWDLTPSAWRCLEGDSLFKRIFSRVGEDDLRFFYYVNPGSETFSQSAPNRVKRVVVQRYFEYEQLTAFIQLANELGFIIPGGITTPGQRAQLQMVCQDGFIGKLPHQAFALAQHHGMSTRLLDWTTNPLFAAFFAVHKVNERLDGSLAVWALDPNALHETSWHQFHVPRSKLGFLHAQQGLFTYHDDADRYYINFGQWPDIRHLKTNQHCPLPFRKLTLEWKHANELRRLLFAERISKAHLMPTLDNIKHTLDGVWSEVMKGERTTITGMQ